MRLHWHTASSIANGRFSRAPSSTTLFTRVSPPSTTAWDSYDLLGRRILIQDRIDGVLTQDCRFIYCGTTLCAKEDRLAGTVTHYYGDGESRAGAGIYYHRDHLGSIRAMTDAAGILTAAYRYDPYGRRTTLLGDAAAVDFGYTGHYVHQASGLALAPYRAYDAEIGRWLSRDPIEEAGGINLYAYVGNNPVDYVDALGLYGIAPDVGQAIDALLTPFEASIDFGQPYLDQQIATHFDSRSSPYHGWANQDKYFHCRANCEAAQRGKSGSVVAQCLSDFHEWGDQTWDGDSPADSAADQAANQFGRNQGANNPDGNCQQLCSQYLPATLPSDY
jgi:RHS repeat-associated protein